MNNTLKDSILSFDDAVNFDEGNDLKKIEKSAQLDAQISQLRLKLSRSKSSLKKSIVEPTVDSVKIAMEVQLIDKELELAIALKAAIFGNV